MAELFVVRTTLGRENQVLDFLSSNAKKLKSVYSILHPQGLAGYVIVEAEELSAVREISRGVPYVRGVLAQKTKYEEIEPMLEFKAEDIEINKGDIVSIIAGPFKGEKAKVNRIDLGKSQVVLELLETAVPIPITIGLDSIKVIGRKKEEEE